MKKFEPEKYEQLKKADFFSGLHPSLFAPGAFDIPPYPGTLKGLKPEDDPEFFRIW